MIALAHGDWRDFQITNTISQNSINNAYIFVDILLLQANLHRSIDIKFKIFFNEDEFTSSNSWFNLGWRQNPPFSKFLKLQLSSLRSIIKYEKPLLYTLKNI